MAILSNIPTKDLRKSANGLTYRKVHDRIIMSRKIESNSSNTEKQDAQRKAFGRLQNIATVLGPYVETGFDGYSYNVRRRAFISANKELSNFIRHNKRILEELEPLECLLRVLQSPLFFGSVYASVGSINSQCMFYRDSDGIPAGTILLPLPFCSSDQVRLVFCQSYELAGMSDVMVRDCAFTLGDKIVNHLKYPNFLTFNHKCVPVLSDLIKLPYGSVIKDACMAATVYRGSGRTTACFGMVDTDVVYM